MSNRRVKTPETAVRLLLKDLQRAISVVTPVQLFAPKLQGTRATAPIAITFYGTSARAKLLDDLWISVSMSIRPGNDGDARKPNWRTHTQTYDFSLFQTEKGRTEILAYHFHPEKGVTWPHLHVTATAKWWGRRGLRRSHLATGRMTIEDFVVFLIDELDVTALRNGWRGDLAQNLAVFGQRRNW